MRAAILQMAVKDGDPEANRIHAEALLAQAGELRLLLLPELWSTGYAHDMWARSAREDTPRLCAWMAGQAHTRQAWVAGTLASLDGAGRLVNRLWIFPPTGEEPVFYDKAHLFRPLGEHEHFAAGGARLLTRTDAFRPAASICFDLRFPEQYRRDAADGADLFLVSAEWPHPRGEALRLLARARAVENQAYLLLANRVGPASDGTVFCGGSMIVSPEGEILADACEQEGLIAANLSPERVHALRERFPVLPYRAAGVDI